MCIHRLLRTGALTVSASLIAWGVAFQCIAGTLEIKVSDEHGESISQVAVYATPVAGTPLKKPNAAKRTASMDQQHNEFVPHVLVTDLDFERARDALERDSPSDQRR